MNLEYLVPAKRRHFWEQRGKAFWGLVTAAVVLLLTLAIAVPLAVVLPRKKHNEPPPGSVILPLYIYPHDNTTWSPVYEALQKHPSLNFTIVVNPNSGPGAGPAPNAQYVEAITTLSSHPNAKLLGYVRTGYATRNVTEVLDDIDVYAGWSKVNPTLAMHGIFLDEAPHIFDADAVELMRRVDEHIRTVEGLYGPKMIVHNPGVIPDPAYLTTAEANADSPSGANSDIITVIYEQSYAQWKSDSNSDNSIQTGLMTANFATSDDKKNGGGERSTYSIMVHSVPKDLTGSELDNFVGDLSRSAEYLYITTNDVDYYESFAPDWMDFVDSVPSGAGNRS
ncbi:spherulin 4-like cell surface protein [Naviculisporaceae sp. PSN 640]